MTNVLIRDIPDEVLAAVDQRAARLGVSRTEYIRRRLAQDTESTPVSVDDLRDFAAAFADLADASVMDEAWE